MKNIILKKSSPMISEEVYGPFLTLQHAINNAINGFYNLFENPSAYSKDIEKLIIHPHTDVREDEKHFKVEVELPGLGEEDVKIFLNNRTLSIRGKKEISRKDEGKNYIWREIGYGFYERDIPLPDYIDIDKAKATFKKSMLWIIFPKKEDAKSHDKEIKIEKEI